MTVQLKRNDTKDTITYKVTNLDGSVVNLTGATVRFVMGKGKTLITNSSATIVNAASGDVSYTLTESDTLSSGTFYAEFEVTFSNGKVKSYPTNGYILVNIQANVDKDQSTYIEDQIAYRVSDIQILKNSIQAQLDQFATGATNAETTQARVEADGTTNATLKARLDKKEAKFSEDIQALSTSLAQRATKEYTDTQLTYKRDKNQKIELEDFGDTAVQAITGGTTLNVLSIPQNESVTAGKTNFLIPSPNLFNKATVQVDYYVDPTWGTFHSSVNNDLSDYIPIEPSAYYVKNVKGHVAFYDASQVFISGISDSVALANVSFQSPTGAKFVRFSIKKSEGYSKDSTQFEKGQTPTSYTPYDFSSVNTNKLDIKKGITFSAKETDFLLPSRNLFDKTKAVLNKFVDPNSGNLADAATNDSSDYIPIEPLTYYVKNVKGHVAFYNSGKGYISGVPESTALANVSFQSPANAVFVRFSIKRSEGYSKDSTQFEKGQTPTKYVSYSLSSFDPNKIEVTGSPSKYKDKKMNFLGDSITEAGKYQLLLQAEFGLALTRNYGVGGTTLVGNGTSGFLDRFSAMDNDADIIFVQGGTNDFSQDITLTKFETDLRALVEGLCQKYPSKIIIFATLPPRYLKYLGANLAGLTTLDYANSTKKICAEYSIPVVDLHNESGIHRFNMDLYMPDKVHPNDAGYVKLSNLIISKLKQL